MPGARSQHHALLALHTMAQQLTEGMEALQHVDRDDATPYVTVRLEVLRFLGGVAAPEQLTAMVGALKVGGVF